jgi:hypothetical protein
VGATRLLSYFLLKEMCRSLTVKATHVSCSVSCSVSVSFSFSVQQHRCDVHTQGPVLELHDGGNTSLVASLALSTSLVSVRTEARRRVSPQHIPVSVQRHHCANTIALLALQQDIEVRLL